MYVNVHVLRHLKEEMAWDINKLISQLRPLFFFLHWVGEKKGLAKWSVVIGDHYAEKISACKPLAFNTFLCTTTGESLEKYAYFKGSIYYRNG